MSTKASVSPSAMASGNDSDKCTGNYAPQLCFECNSSFHCDSRISGSYTMLQSDSNHVFEISDLMREQIERNNRIADQLSPVLKYKEMMRKARSKAPPRRKYSIAQGCPRWRPYAPSNSHSQTRTMNVTQKKDVCP
ncbi:hypothetical protein GCK32_014024 [Trichostrongylus colubriformis]|uniref:Uncharacterized protein n=1 Tax=Trichostrongylus colubriformis TaxID=6319 RepID=A0AAN8FWB9_TRICO